MRKKLINETFKEAVNHKEREDYDDLDELMRAVEEDYDNKPPYENYVFNCVDEYEFSIFLQNKYNVAIMEITTIRYHISRI